MQLFNRHKNIQFGTKDQQQSRHIHLCTVTGHEIYEGNTYLQVERDIVEDDLEALIEHIGAVRKVAGEEADG